MKLFKIQESPSEGEFLPRWVLASSTRRAHLDVGHRSSQSLRVRATHIIVTACQAHLDASAPVVAENYQPKCSNCLRIHLTVRRAQQIDASKTG
jgi:hypothetical protein